MKNEKQTLWLIGLLKAVLAFIGVTALFAGPQLIWDPSGSSLGMSTELLKDSPFHDFLIPGVLLTLFIGLYPLLVFCWVVWPGLFGRLERLNPAPRYPLRWQAVVVTGLALVIWISVQVVMVGFTMLLQLFYFALGLLVLFVAFLPGVNHYFGVWSNRPDSASPRHRRRQGEAPDHASHLIRET